MSERLNLLCWHPSTTCMKPGGKKLMWRKSLYFISSAKYSIGLKSLESTPQLHVNLVLRYQTNISFCVPYSGKLSREKTFANWWKYDFRGENFRGLPAFVMPKDTTLQISWRKLSCIAAKPRNLQKFSPSKVFRYTVQVPHMKSGCLAMGPRVYLGFESR